VWHHMYGIEVMELMFGNFAIPSDRLTRFRNYPILRQFILIGSLRNLT